MAASLAMNNAMSIAERLAATRAAIDKACIEAGRDPSAVELVAVSKRHSIAAIEEAYEAGQRVFGESYADELVRKADGTKHLPDIAFRFIGHLQRNKAARVAAQATAVDSVDSVRLARALARHTQGLEVLVQVQVIPEESKSGVSLGELPALLEVLEDLPTLHVRGLMTLPPQEPSAAQRAFEGLAHAATEHGLEVLSMGMSGDLATAIGCGSTMVRVGTAIFGPRP